MDCTKCGNKIEAGDEFCRKCGESLLSEAETTISLSPIEIEEELGDVELSVAEEPVLIVKKGPFVGQKFNLSKDEITLGRDPGSDIFLDDVTVSRNHAKITMHGSRVSVADVGSLNGTYVNQERIEIPTLLKSSDELQVGKFKLVFLTKKD